ncbi:MAG: hypothetical protein ACI9S8_000169 [Chlamydiales bacterium]|jgi:hypothetical protein
MEKKWILFFTSLLLISLLGAFGPDNTREIVVSAPIDAGDTAWMLTAASLVLLMTPGLG